MDTLENDISALKLNKNGIIESLGLETEEADDEDMDESLRESLLNKLSGMDSL